MYFVSNCFFILLFQKRWLCIFRFNYILYFGISSILINLFNESCIDRRVFLVMTFQLNLICLLLLFVNFSVTNILWYNSIWFNNLWILNYLNIIVLCYIFFPWNLTWNFWLVNLNSLIVYYIGFLNDSCL